MNLSKLESRLKALESLRHRDDVVIRLKPGDPPVIDTNEMRCVNYADLKPTTGPPSSRPGFVKPDTPKVFWSQPVKAKAPAEPVAELCSDIPTAAPDDEPAPGTRAYRDRWGTRDTLNK